MMSTNSTLGEQGANTRSNARNFARKRVVRLVMCDYTFVGNRRLGACFEDRNANN